MDIRNLDLPTHELATFCRQWQVAELALFGSVLRDDFAADSDIDILVGFDPAARRTLFDMVTMQDELSAILGRRVDLVSKRGIERSRNPIRRREILSTAQAIHVA